MQRSVYLESSIISYLAARPSRDVITLALQALTREWWQLHRHSYRLVTSEVVLGEIKAGDPDAASRRLELLEAVPLLDVSLARSLGWSAKMPLEQGMRLTYDWMVSAMAGSAEED